MKERRSNNLLVEPPASATGDIAFNLIVFFLVCASVQPDAGRRQTIPKADEQEEKKEETKNIEVALTRDTVAINGDVVRVDSFLARLKEKLSGKTRPQDRVVVVRSKPETPYSHWIIITSMIEDAGGIVTLQIEEEEQVRVQ